MPKPEDKHSDKFFYAWCLEQFRAEVEAKLNEVFHARGLLGSAADEPFFIAEYDGPGNSRRRVSMHPLNQVELDAYRQANRELTGNKIHFEITNRKTTVVTEDERGTSNNPNRKVKDRKDYETQNNMTRKPGRG